MKLRLTGLFLLLWIGVSLAQGSEGTLRGEVRPVRMSMFAQLGVGF